MQEKHVVRWLEWLRYDFESPSGVALLIGVGTGSAAPPSKPDVRIITGVGPR